MLNYKEKNLYKFISILVCCLLFFITPVYADGYADVVIQTDGTFNNHEVITSCEVGKEVTIDVGGFDTVYYNNNFNVNISNGDGTATFTCSDTNDLKLAYYGVSYGISGSYVTGTPSTWQSLINDTYDYPITDEVIDLLVDTAKDYNYVISCVNNGGEYVTFLFANEDWNKILARFNSKTLEIVNTNPAWQFTYKLWKSPEMSMYESTGDIRFTDTVNIYGNVDPSGSGTVSGTGEYAVGTSVTLTATANNGYQFVEWSNGSTDNPLTITATTNTTYTAIFTAIPSSTQYNVTGSVNPEGSGYIDGLGTYSENDLVTVSAHAYDGYIFSHWNTGSTSAYLTFNITENRNYIAYFEEDPDYVPPSNTFTISGTVSPGGSGSINGLGTYDVGTSVTLTAIANDGYSFIQWENGDTNAERVISTSSDISVIAYFVSNDSSGGSLLLETNDIILDYICNDSLSYTYRMNQKIVKGVNFDVYAKSSTAVNYILIQEDINEFIISNVTSVSSSNGCYFTPYLTNTETKLLNDGVTISTRDGAIIYKFVVTEKSDPLVDGTDDSNESVDKNDTQNAELDSVITEYNEIEGQFKDNLDTSLNDIDFTFDFGSITDFSTSANFVRAQFDNLTNNPFGSLVGFSLAVGLALLIMGRRL